MLMTYMRGWGSVQLVPSSSAQSGFLSTTLVKYCHAYRTDCRKVKEMKPKQMPLALEGVREGVRE